MLKRWIPWKFLIKRTAKAYGVVDPITLLARMRRFAQPSEIQEPIELLRAGIIFHARGLINTRAIQHNLDWIWPYWVERQFNPNDLSFIPRGFSFSHVNLTHRNWTAVGQPDLPLYPLVGPRGLVTPLYDGWSVDFWVLIPGGSSLFPSKLEHVDQSLELSPDMSVRTQARLDGCTLTTAARVSFQARLPVLEITAEAVSDKEAFLAFALRPYNPEGIQFIEKIAFDSTVPVCLVNADTRIRMSEMPERVFCSNYHEGDVIHKIEAGEECRRVKCEVGMATGAALFPVGPEGRKIDFQVPLAAELRREFPRYRLSTSGWDELLEGTATLQVPDSRVQFLYEAAVRTLILLSAHEVVPGPYTYRRFWFRDACFMLNALLGIGLAGRCHRILEDFLHRQRPSGYFRSQEGEWDSNGQVLWIFNRYQRLTGYAFDRKWMKTIFKGVEWIQKKRISSPRDSIHWGLFPPGFSAEHFGPNDYYYWDDFWGAAGLKGAARLARLFSSSRKGREVDEMADEFLGVIFQSIDRIPEEKKRGGIPASPYRRMDAGAVGSMVADYPLQLTPPGDPRIMQTAEFLVKNSFHKGAFFQDMIHSGLNPYLTLSIAQTFLRSGDPRYSELLRTVAGLASPTGHWPEAVHPFTRGGCMGDGQHGWAAAEWVMMIRNLFVREEGEGLVLGEGVFPEWLREEGEIAFGPTLTPWGNVRVKIVQKGRETWFHLEPSWQEFPPRVDIRVPGYRPTAAEKDRTVYHLEIDAP